MKCLFYELIAGMILLLLFIPIYLFNKLVK